MSQSVYLRLPTGSFRWVSPSGKPVGTVAGWPLAGNLSQKAAVGFYFYLFFAFMRGWCNAEPWNLFSESHLPRRVCVAVNSKCKWCTTYKNITHFKFWAYDYTLSIAQKCPVFPVRYIYKKFVCQLLKIWNQISYNGNTCALDECCSIAWKNRHSAWRFRTTLHVFHFNLK